MPLLFVCGDNRALSLCSSKFNPQQLAALQLTSPFRQVLKYAVQGNTNPLRPMRELVFNLQQGPFQQVRAK